MRSLDTFYLGLREPNSSCLTALRAIILNSDPDLTEALKYGMPFFSYRQKMICYFWINKKTGLPYIGFKDGKQLNFPWLEHGDRTMFSIMPIDPYEDIPVSKVSKTLKGCIKVIKKAL